MRKPNYVPALLLWGVLCLAYYAGTATAGNEISGYDLGVTQVYGASALYADDTAFSTLDTRQRHFCQDFDATTDETCILEGAAPDTYGGGDVTVEVHWAATTATTGAVIWRLEAMAIAANDLDVDSETWDTIVYTSADTTNGTSGKITVSTFTVTNANFDDINAGDGFLLRIGRDADSTGTGTDDMTGDAELYRVLIRWAP